MNIHFVHIVPKETKGKTVIPLLLLHKWPGSIREFNEFLPLLTTPNKNFDFVFEVIAQVDQVLVGQTVQLDQVLDQQKLLLYYEI